VIEDHLNNKKKQDIGSKQFEIISQTGHPVKLLIKKFSVRFFEILTEKT